jgi:hypothetical protein
MEYWDSSTPTLQRSGDAVPLDAKARFALFSSLWWVVRLPNLGRQATQARAIAAVLRWAGSGKGCDHSVARFS